MICMEKMGEGLEGWREKGKLWREKEKYGGTRVEIRSLKEFEGKQEYEGTGGKGGV